MRRLRKVLLIALAALAGVVLLTMAAWAADSHSHRGRVARNVDLIGTPVGGMRRPELTRAVAQITARYGTARIYITAPRGSIITDAQTLGVSLDPAKTVDATMRVGRRGGIVHELGSWLRGLVSHRRAPVHVNVDQPAVYRVVPAEDPGPQTAPTEPTIHVEGSALVAVGGKPGKGIDPAEVIEKVPAAARFGTPITVRVHRGSVQPRFDVGAAEKLAGQAESLTRSSMPMKAGSATTIVPVKTLRSWVRSEARDDGLHVVLDAKKATADLAAALPNAGTPAVETKFVVVNNVPQIVAGSPGTGCCAMSAADLILDALERGRPSTTPLTLPLTKVDPKLTVEQAQALGIKEQVSTFTTPHACCLPRVHNIHLIADTVRGYVIKPGETFSVNATVGKRTLEKGYVVAPVIANGVEDEDVGGGVSQFATTTFNAAFFAGLDFGEYQSHSIWISSRYPRGREATMGWPHPDLQIKNTTPYGILIWPTYTDKSLTVTFYSTHYVDATQTNQTDAPKGPCTRVTTERTRTYLDGTVKVDKVFATYQPKEGVRCF